MKKWSLLVAVLLMGATATTFTSCVDTDEPEGILNMRNAKADYIRALAAVENARIAHVQAQAQAEAANAELLKAQKEAALAQAEVAKAQAQAEIIKAEAQAKADALLAEGKNEIAKAEAAKILAEAAQAEAECQQTIAMNEIKLKEMQAKLEVVLQETQTKMVYAQAQYQLALKDLAALDLVASKYEAELLDNARTAYDTAYGELQTASEKVTSAQKNLLSGIYGAEDDAEKLEHKLADKKAELVAINAAYAEIKKLAENLTPTAWEARRDSLAEYIGNGTLEGASKLEKAELELKLQEIKQSPEYATANAQDQKDLKAFVQAQQEYNYLANKNENKCFDEADAIWTGSNKITAQFGYQSNGAVHAGTAARSAKTYEMPEVAVKVENAQVLKMLKDAGAPVSALPNNNGEGLYIKEKKNADAINYTEVENAFKADKNGKYVAIATWETKLTQIKVQNETIAADTCKSNLEKAVADAKTEHAKKVDAWKAAHETYQTGKVANPTKTDDAKAAIKLYNTNLEALKTAVTAWNTEYDAAKNKVLDEAIEKQMVKEAKSEIMAELAKTGKGLETVWDGVYTETDYPTIASVEEWIQGQGTTYFTTDEDKATIKSAVRKKIEGIWGPGLKSDKKDAIAKDGVTLTEEKIIAKMAATVKENLTNAEKKLTAAAKDDKKAYTGSYLSIAEVLKDLLETAQKNSEKFDKDYRDQIHVLTGTEIETPKAGEDKDAVVAAGEGWAIAEVKTVDSKNVLTGHKIVYRTAINDDMLDKMVKLVLDTEKAEKNWIDASTAAFGTIDKKEAARHTELTASMINNEKNEDELARTLGKLNDSTLGKLIAAEKALADSKTVLAANDYIETLKTLVAAAKKTIEDKQAEYKKPVDEAKKAIDPAKAAHQESHNAAKKLTDPVQNQINAIGGKIANMTAIKNAIQNILNAYYGNQTIKYTDENGDEQKVSWTDAANKDFAQVEKWIKTQLKKYDTKAGVNTEAAIPGDDHGKIANKEAEIAALEKIMKRLEENGYSSEGLADGKPTGEIHDYIVKDLEYALELAQKNYDYKLAQFNNAEAALNKVLEAVGNGTPLTNYPNSNTTTGATSNGGEYVPGQTNTDITVDLYGQANTGITIDL